jgi:hypothetical protein
LDGGPWAAPWAYPITYSRIGNIVILHILRFLVNNTTGGDADYVYLGTAPVGLIPVKQQVQSVGGVIDGGNLEDTAYGIIIFTTGNIYLFASNGNNLTVDWGLYRDVNVTYTLG